MNRAAARRLLVYLLDRACARRRLVFGEVSLVVTDDAGIREINRLHLQHDDSTDVITYTFPPLRSAGWDTLAGEIYVNAAMARRLGPRYRGVARELALYIAHGCDHLTGAEDQTPDGRALMRRRELGWIAAAAERGLLREVMTP